MKTLTTIVFVMTATTAFANDMEVHFNGGQAQSNCQTFLNNHNLSGQAQCHQSGNSGSSFNSDNDKSVSRVQVQGNDLVIAVTNQDPSGAYSKEHRVTLPTNTGAKGDKGDDGAAGAQGAKGDTGNKGQDGLQGVKGDTGSNGQDGAKGIQGVAGKDAISGLALVAALDSIKGDGIGFGLTKEEDSDFTFSTAVKFEIDNRTNVNIGITITEDGRKAASAGIGFSF
jgi:hypothetical protein